MIELPAGTEFAGLRLEAVTGRGGMGVVYRASELALERTVALKVMAACLIEDEAALRRFARESRLAASIEHPNVIPIHAAGEHDGRADIVMRCVEGADLRALTRHEGPLAAERAAPIVAQAAAGLDAAHRAGLVHRDVKPANILLAGDEHAYLTDFGLTRGDWSSSGPQPTKSGVFVGTSDCVAPEQIRGGAVNARADFYPLGAVIFHALTGEAPFAGRNHEAIPWAHLTEPPPAAAGRFDPVIARAMAKRPADRYPSAGDLGRAALAAASRRKVREPERAVGVGTAAPDDSLPTPAGRQTAPQAVVAGGGRRTRSRRRCVPRTEGRRIAAAGADAHGNGDAPAAERPASSADPDERTSREPRRGRRPGVGLVGTRTRLVSISLASSRSRWVADLPPRRRGARGRRR